MGLKFGFVAEHDILKEAGCQFCCSQKIPLPKQTETINATSGKGLPLPVIFYPVRPVIPGNGSIFLSIRGVLGIVYGRGSGGSSNHTVSRIPRAISYYPGLVDVYLPDL